jgi:hypothetical protein
MDKDQEDADRLQKALLKKERPSFDWRSFAYGLQLALFFIAGWLLTEHILNWMYFYD